MKKLLALLFLTLMMTGCFGAKEDPTPVDEGDVDLHEATDAAPVEAEVVYAEPELEIEPPTEIPEELDQPTTPPPTN